MVEHYAPNGAAKVSIVEMQDQIGKDLDLVTKISMNEIMNDHGVHQYTNTKLIEVKDNEFIIECDGVVEVLPFDLGFICLGMRASAPMIGELEQYACENKIVLKNLGDSKMARRIMEGTREARDIASVLELIDSLKEN